jgi:DNA-binding NarL/FixJ family response regulator
MTIRVLLADDQALIRGGFAALIRSADDMLVVGEAVDGADALRQARDLRPDVVLMDIRMPGIDGLEATRRIRSRVPEVAVVMLTTYDLDEHVFDAVRAGAAGFFLKDGDAEDLLRGIRAAASGDALMSPTALARLMREFATTSRRDHAAERAVAGLTDREREVLRLAALGLNNEEIARVLVLSVATVKSHVSRTLAKLGVRDRTQAVVIAYRSGLASAEPTEIP